MFEPAKNFMFTATSKYKLDDVALGALICENTRRLILTDYPNFASTWEPLKFKSGSLTIRAQGSSGAELFMQTQTLLLKLEALDLPKSVQQIKIVKV
jgi:hypothetical protein